MEVPREVMAEVEAAGFVLSTDGNDLVVRRGRPHAAFTPQLRALIEAYKAELFALVMQQWVQANVKRVLADAQAKEAETAKFYDTMPMVPGRVPPNERVLAQQEWLASLDWSRGLRCGRTKQQCTTCRGIPCHGSTEWQEG